MISLAIFSAVAVFFMAIVLFVFFIAPAGDGQARALMWIVGSLSFVACASGVMLFLVFPRVKIVFDPSRREVFIQKGSANRVVVGFGELQPFQIYETIRGYAHQYHCRNASLGEYSDLFFSASHRTTVKKARRLATMTAVALIDCDGKDLG
jgi:hypothetical protein